ncbi:tRNA (adenosine(37)-N6)-dimethylallyltransferase MiaA [Streptococcus anginosus]|uniref:tRNA dimethylallyltransferase n=1 Tax=Streptococcus anginosus SK1138 TaxID=1161422 RepID=A0AAD2T6V0_STRAP|nr:tRNA (adenosine(37)-N6)-dimethylallyltransferase MiaA [Streptococcus anginosus]EJP24739.1 tRNA dimethylallyltransferase [Streptococcus anginosus SK1138]MCY7223455.1 tRNA (adenosine(37)-N6)-dimethylallyltransferase MiaA [Streptococcus anginosus]RIB36703.1 tRNA (adenosine(37)-N6)-dimethylallyltransferase MiaA [Streptococcus anginosus]
MKTKIIVIVGPTAVGKTALSIDLAKRFNGEIISGDSQQVYRKLNIGTAKVTPDEQEGIPHYLIDVREVTEFYSAFDFVKEAEAAVEMIVAKGKLPIIAGGTGLYIQSLLEGYHLGGSASYEEILAYRAELDTLADEELFGKIAELGIKIPQINRRRAMRALEIAHLGNELENKQPDYEALLICLDDDREVLYERINQRVDLMLKAGLLEEAKWLYDNYPHVQASKGIGYKELFPYFAGELTLEEAINKLKQNTRRFAKRQLTWFRNRMNATFYQVSEPNVKERIMQDIEEFLND